MIALDCNILVQLAFENHPEHAKTVAKVEFEVGRGEMLVFPPLTAAEFLHVATDQRRINPPLTMLEALAWLKEFIELPSVGVIHSNDASLNRTIEWMEHHKLGRKRILDTELAAIAHANGANRLLTSNPADFAIFKAIEVVSP
jgi:predicted nucleic acid-binding protein